MFSGKAGIVEKSRGPGLGVIWAYLDNDRDLDLYVANDAESNYLYLNRSDGTFEEKGLITGLALSGDGRAQASMGVDAADYDNDGRLDVFATHFAADYSTLYHNKGNLLWEDSTLNAKLFKAYGLLVGWGTRFADFDNDGWKDIYHSNGHVYTFLKKSGFRGSLYSARNIFPESEKRNIPRCLFTGGNRHSRATVKPRRCLCRFRQ